jgi:hypothetical protein
VLIPEVQVDDVTHCFKGGGDLDISWEQLLHDQGRVMRGAVAQDT